MRETRLVIFTIHQTEKQQFTQCTIWTFTLIVIITTKRNYPKELTFFVGAGVVFLDPRKIRFLSRSFRLKNPIASQEIATSKRIEINVAFMILLNCCTTGKPSPVRFCRVLPEHASKPFGNRTGRCVCFEDGGVKLPEIRHENVLVFPWRNQHGTVEPQKGPDSSLCYVLAAFLQRTASLARAPRDINWKVTHLERNFVWPSGKESDR